MAKDLVKQGKGYSPSRYLRKVQDPLKYECRKLQVLIRVMDHQMSLDASKFDIKAYCALLERHTVIIDKLIKRGWNDEDLDKQGLEKSLLSEREKTVRKGKSSSVGTGVSAKNPFA